MFDPWSTKIPHPAERLSPVRHNCWAHLQSPQVLKPERPRACDLQQEKPPQREGFAAAETTHSQKEKERKKTIFVGQSENWTANIRTMTFILIKHLILFRLTLTKCLGKMVLFSVASDKWKYLVLLIILLPPFLRVCVNTHLPSLLRVMAFTLNSSTERIFLVQWIAFTWVNENINSEVQTGTFHNNEYKYPISSCTENPDSNRTGGKEHFYRDNSFPSADS